MYEIKKVKEDLQIKIENNEPITRSSNHIVYLTVDDSPIQPFSIWISEIWLALNSFVFHNFSSGWICIFIMKF